MLKRILFPVILGVVGVAILLSLGFWQLRRLEWKTDILAGIEARLAADPMDFAAIATPDPETMRYQAVRLAGRTTGEELLVLSGRQGEGAGYRVISAFETDTGRRVMLDRGFIFEVARAAPRPAVALTVTGNLMWPQDGDAFTPPPDAKTGLWFARDVPGMAATLATEPVLVVQRLAEGDAQGVEAGPVTTAGIPNDHFGYALTWFSLAIVWAGMTVFLLWRITRTQS